MNLAYTQSMPGMARTIQATLEAGEQLGNHSGPITMFIPEDGANAEFADIERRGLPIAPAPA